MSILLSRPRKSSIIAWCAVAIGATAALFSSLSIALPYRAAIRADTGCFDGSPCAGDISSQKVQKKADAFAEASKICLQKAREEEQRRSSIRPPPGGLPIEGIFRKAGCQPNAELMPPRCATGVDEGIWASIDDVSDGQTALDAFRVHLETGKVFNKNLIAVEIIQSKGDEQHIAVCHVRTIHGASGPPQDCTAVAVITPTHTFLRASELPGSQIILGCPVFSTVQLGGTAVVIFEIKTDMDPLKLADSLGGMLENDLKFQIDRNAYYDSVGKISSITFRATAPDRESVILGGGQREAVDLDLQLYVEPHKISLNATAKPTICRQASVNTVEYHQADPQQIGKYAAVLNKKINDAIIRVCSAPHQDDDKHITCQ